MSKAVLGAPVVSRKECTTSKPSERTILVSALNKLGLVYLDSSEDVTTGLPEGQELFSRLWNSDDARLRQAPVLLLLTHPDLAPAAQASISALTGKVADLAKRRYVAACACQRMARTRIQMQLGASPLLPPLYLEELALPTLDERFGRMTLYTLAGQEQDRYGYNAWGMYLSLLDLFVSQSRIRGWGKRS